jgi:hypothetical protein
MGFERMEVGKWLCCLLAIQLFASGRAEYYDTTVEFLPPGLQNT